MRRSLLVVVLLLALVAACTGGDDGDAAGGDGVDLPEGDDLSDVVVAGLAPGSGEIAFADYEGRPVVVNFFASTCAPCVEEMPAIESVKADVGESVAFVGVATNDPVDDALALVEETGVTWDLARDPQGDLIVAVGGVALPTTVLVDADGVIADVHTGALDAGELRSLLRDELGVDA